MRSPLVKVKAPIADEAAKADPIPKRSAGLSNDFMMFGDVCFGLQNLLFRELADRSEGVESFERGQSSAAKELSEGNVGYTLVTHAILRFLVHQTSPPSLSWS